ncbi:cytosine permease [Lachnospiraceae bacterium 62-35]
MNVQDEKSTGLRSPELLPTKDSERTLSLWDYTILWAGMTINIVAFSLGAQYYNGGDGLSPWMLIAVVFIGYGLVTALTVLAGDIGTKYGVPFAVYSRAAFGYKGSYLAGLVRCIPCFYWFGFQTWVGASALNMIMGIVMPGFNNVTLMLLLFAAFQIINALFGMEAMAKFDWIAVPCLGIMFAAIVVTICNKYNVTIPDIMNVKAAGNYSMAFAVSGIAGGWITMALNGPDLARQIKRSDNYKNESLLKRNQRAISGQLIGLMAVGIIAMMVGMAAGVFTGEWDLNNVVYSLFSNNLLMLVFCFISIAFAQWSTNTAANLMPPAYILLNIFPKMKFWMTTIISGVIGLLMMPWKQQGGDFLVVIQSNFSTLLGPIIGIMLSDYFLVRKMILNVDDLYNAGGQYEYTKGFNISAIATIVISFGLSMLAGDYSFFAGLAISVVIYLFMMKTFTLKKYDQNLGKEVPFQE